MKKNIRFIKTKVGDDGVYLILTKCDNCPYIAKDVFASKVRCGHSFGSKNRDNVILNDAEFIIKNNNIENKSDVQIPEWCSLCDRMKDEMDKKLIRYKSDGVIYSLLSFFRKGVDKILPDIYVTRKNRSDELEYNEDGKFFLENQVKLKENENVIIKPLQTFEHNSVVVNNTIQKNICSCCGEGKEEVDRYINDGICNDCLDIIKNDKKVKYRSYINNFRLKRKSTWSKNNFEIINNLI